MQRKGIFQSVIIIEKMTSTLYCKKKAKRKYTLEKTSTDNFVIWREMHKNISKENKAFIEFVREMLREHR
jgi:hypothetical protein